MAKKDKPHNEHLFRCERLNVRLTHMNTTPAKRDGGEYQYHDTIGVEAVLHEDDLIDTLQEMGVDHAEYIRSQPEQIWHWPLDGCRYYEHTVQLLVSRSKVGAIEEAEIYNCEIERAGDEQYKLRFSYKGVPQPDKHRKLELAYLDSKAGKLHHLIIAPPAQQELEQHSHETEEV